MKILALIPARKNSKRIPKKNKIIFFKQPLFMWTIKLAKKIPEITDILISTDDNQILKIAKKSGILAPWLRPKKLSLSKTSSVDMAIHALDWYEKKLNTKVDGILLLQPTSPFRTKRTVKKCINIFRNKKCDSVITVKKSSLNPKILAKIDKKVLKPLFSEKTISSFPKNIYHPDGSIYLIKPSILKKSKKFYGKHALPVIINSQKESIDIDTFEDLEIAKFYKNK